MKCRHIQNLRLQSLVRDDKPHLHYAIGGTIIVSEGEIMDSFPSFEIRDFAVPISSKLQHSELSNDALIPMKFRNLMSNKPTLTCKSSQLEDPIKQCYTKESRYAE